MRPNLAVLRSAIGPMLTETGTMTRQDGYTTDPDGFEIPNMVTVFSGPVLVRPEGTIEYVTVGGVARPQRDYDVTFPAGSDVLIGDELVLSVVPHDAALSGAEITITDVPLDAWQVARFCKGTRQA